MQVVVLGCGGSGGVPLISQGWGSCDPNNPRNRRRRPAILVRTQEAVILVDTPPDLREQLLDASVRHLDAVFYTHSHADHVHGLDDLREINRLMRASLPVYATPETLEQIVRRFGYAFIADDSIVTSIYRPILRTVSITDTVQIKDITVLPFEQDHGFSTTLGFRFGPIAYSTDVVSLPERAFTILTGITVWIVDCFTKSEHRTHASLSKVLQWVETIKPYRTILTHMGSDLDYSTLKTSLPVGIEPAFDGMLIEV